MLLTSLTKYRDAGLLILRVGIGLVFVIHGAPKLFGGPVRWTELGKATAAIGIDVFPTMMGFIAACSECIGGILLALGLLFRPAAILLALTMTVATAWLFRKDPGMHQFATTTSHPLKMAILFYSLVLIGPGRFSFDKN